MAEKTVKIRLTSAVVIGGKIRSAGHEPTVSQDLAKNLMQRGKAELATSSVEKPLGEMTVAELKIVAAGLDIEGFDGLNKAKLISAIEDAQEDADE